MSTKPVKDPALDEHILQVEPHPRPFVEAGWLSRPNLYTGRTMSAQALSADQRERAGRLALRGQMVAPGVVAGLEVRLRSEHVPGQEMPRYSFDIDPGMGLAASGEDVYILRDLNVRVDRLPVYWPGSLGPAGFDLGLLGSVDAVTTHAGLKAAVLVLVPVVSRREDPPDPNDPGESDPDVHALEDQRLVDGSALVLFAWPREWPLPPLDSERDRELWRNRLAWELFNREQQRPSGQCAPWEELGVPLALVGFEPPHHYHAPATPLFVDRAAVVRTGGAPRGRTPLLESRGSPLLWQARSLQFAEQLSSFSAAQLSSTTATAPFDLLPPLGTLPKEAVDLFTWQHRFFPAPFLLDAVPVPLEQLDAIAQASASLAPLRTSHSERVRILVPVPEAHFEPHLLREELLDPAFQQAISSALGRLGQWLARRKDLRNKALLLSKALKGKTDELKYPDVDPARVEGEPSNSELPTPTPPEEPYGTQDSDKPDGGFVPELVSALSRAASWEAAPVRRALNSVEVSVAAPSSGGKYAVLSRPNTEISSPTHLDLLYFENAKETQERISTEASWVEFQTLWSGDGLKVVILVHNEKDPADKPRIRLGQRTGTTWDWSDATDAAGEALNPRGYKFSQLVAVTWGEGNNNVDAFVVFNPTDDTQGSRIVKFTWFKDKPRAPVPEPLTLSPARVVDQLVAVDRGEGQVDLLFLGREPGKPGGSWLHRVPLIHQTRPADGSDKFELKPHDEAPTLRGTRLAACVTEDASRKRLNVLVMAQGRGGGIRHGWHDGSWKLGMEVVSQTSGEALVALSRGRQIHAFWWQSPDDGGAFFYSTSEGSGWSRPQLLTQREHNPAIPRGAFGVVQEGNNPFDVFLATTSGLQQLRKLHETTKQTVEEKGLRGLIQEIDLLNQKVVDFIRDGSAQVQQELQHVRQLMLTSSTEATRLAASGTRGSTLVDNPLLASQGLQNYLTSFSMRARRTQLIRLSDSLETLQQATALRRDLTSRLIDLVREVSKVKEFGLDVKGMLLLGVSNTQISSGSPRVSLVLRKKRFWLTELEETKTVARENIPLLSLVNDPVLSTKVLARLSDEPENLRRALSQSRFRWVESDYFSTAIRHLENTRALLQELERRMRNRVGSVENYRRTLARIEGYWTELDNRLKVVEGEVAEARQDVTVGRALLAEEVLRIGRVNQRRRQVFEQHVPFLVFQRPRESDLTYDGPSRMLDPGLTEDLLPKVFASTAAAPPELLSYTELLRDSPLKWFALAPQLLRGLDRLEFIQRTYVRAQARAIQRVPIRVPVYSGLGLTRYAQGLSRLLSAREDVIARTRLSFVQYYQPAILETRTWLELQQSAREHLSLGDLIDTSHGRPDVGRDAALELEHISKVATGLYQRFGEVLPSIRLEWAEQMSQYDEAVDLHDLSLLPQWDQLDGTDRREMQTLVDWLFQRVLSTEPEAVSLMNDLVRVCMLLASHAPVNELLSGHVSKPTVAKVGGSIELAVDPSRVRIGMNVRIRSGDQTVEAVVEDLSSGVARARVLSTSAATVHLQEKASARFADPARGPGAFTDAIW